jgi:hypothetical protein
MHLYKFLSEEEKLMKPIYTKGSVPNLAFQINFLSVPYE